jgi:hypothetical protein
MISFDTNCEPDMIFSITQLLAAGIVNPRHLSFAQLVPYIANRP